MMKHTLLKNKIALHVALALSVATLTVGCASNSAKKTDMSAMQTPVVVAESKPVVSEVKSEAPIETVQIEENPAAPVIQYPDIDIQQHSKPEIRSFQFGFDKAELSAEDVELVKQHAQFLLDNPEVMVKINGHTDHYGPKVYNEYLSKKRADAVAKILIEEGVQESQLQISALANDEPLLDVADTRKNRRVDLQYIEMNMVSTQ